MANSLSKWCEINKARKDDIAWYTVQSQYLLKCVKNKDR
jgi:hypothetical protein